MKTTRISIITGVLLLLLAAGLNAQQKGINRVKAGLPPQAARSFDQMVKNARARGLPIEPLIDKGLEGIAKGRPPEMIIRAVRQRADLLGRAQATLRPFGRPAPAEVASVADAMQRGMTPELVKRVRSGARPNEPVAMSVHTFADLLERKVPANVGLEMISTWRSRGAQLEHLRAIPPAVERLVRDGATPTDAAKSVNEALRDGRSPHSGVWNGSEARLKKKPDADEKNNRGRRRKGNNN